MLKQIGKVLSGYSLAVIAVGLLVGGAAWSADLAKVNGKTITSKDLQMALGNMAPGQREGILKDGTMRKQVLLNVIDQEILAQEAEKEKLDQDSEFKEALEGFRKQFLASKLLQKNLAAKLNDKAAKRHYELHKIRYSTDQARAQHILVPTNAEAVELLKKAKAPNADFQKLAEQYSKDPTAKNNRGDLGFFGRDQMVPEFSEAVFSANAGDIVGPIKTSYGFHVIKVIQKKNGKPMEYSEVELRVKNDLKQELVEEFVGKLKKQAKVTIDDSALEKM